MATRADSPLDRVRRRQRLAIERIERLLHARCDARGGKVRIDVAVQAVCVGSWSEDGSFVCRVGQIANNSLQKIKMMRIILMMSYRILIRWLSIIT